MRRAQPGGHCGDEAALGRVAADDAGRRVQPGDPAARSDDAVVVVENCGQSGSRITSSGEKSFTSIAVSWLSGCQ